MQKKNPLDMKLDYNKKMIKLIGHITREVITIS